ncbi:MAG: class II aldolase/adducin family protein [Cytophagaceae bacterium]|jgi:rhamnose utilization protein RhaD (predicted bifunctional aldolase and dehydrogenase)|nr:class II aldolase/adducin family protein [Cytophagaceae bacterium]
MREIDEFVKLSRFAGERVDLTQAGGGNSSVKTADNTMHIKASGFLLSEVTAEKAFASLCLSDLQQIWNDPHLPPTAEKRAREAYANQAVEKARKTFTYKPSIETLLHAAIPYTFVLHTHPVAVTTFTCRSNWKEELSRYFPDALYVPYATPGLELTLQLLKEMQKEKNEASLVFLQNHGLIISGNDPEKICLRYNEVGDVLAKAAGLNLEHYKTTNLISQLVNQFSGKQQIAYLVEDVFIQQLCQSGNPVLFTPPFGPDTYVFGGKIPLWLPDLNNHQALLEYKKQYHEFPKVIIWDKKVYCLADHVKKAKEMEEVMKFHWMAASKAHSIQYLSNEEMDYLGNWDAEKYRQSL